MRPDFETAWRRRFETFGREHEDDAGIAGWSEAGLQARFRNFARSWRPAAAGAFWLDAGCGAGTYARTLASSGQHVLALDYSLPSLVKARSRAQEQPLLWVAGDVTALPLRSDSFDGVVCFGVLQSLSGPERAISELARVLRPDGELWVDALNARCLPNLFGRWRAKARGQETRLRYDTVGILKRALREGGFRSVRISWVPILPERLRFAQALLESRVVRWLLGALPWLGSAVSHAYVLTARR
ncbi:MAG: methyltransferase domain-containing protein [Burkholderiales bacterium]|nr:methyltransferase domain-containing protein [Burkholderiales bacterium]